MKKKENSPYLIFLIGSKKPIGFLQNDEIYIWSHQNQLSGGVCLYPCHTMTMKKWLSNQIKLGNCRTSYLVVNEKEKKKK